LRQELLGMLPERRSGKVGAVPATVNAHGTPDRNDLALRRMAQRPEGLEMFDLRVLDYLGDVVDRRKRHILPFKECHPFGTRPGQENIGKRAGEIQVLAYARFAGSEARVMRKLRARDCDQQAFPEFRLRREMDRKQFPVAAAECKRMGACYPGERIIADSHLGVVGKWVRDECDSRL